MPPLPQPKTEPQLVSRLISLCSVCSCCAQYKAPEAYLPEAVGSKARREQARLQRGQDRERRKSGAGAKASALRPGLLYLHELGCLWAEDIFCGSTGYLHCALSKVHGQASLP